jgi:DHA2 family multidrug resistance protein
MVSYVDAFWGLFLVILVITPMILFMRPPRAKPSSEELAMHLD